MAGEVRSESPAALPLTIPKRHRACVAELGSVSCAAPDDGEEEADGHRDGSSFLFHHAVGDFVALETMPQYGSFDPPAAAEQAATEPKPAQPAGQDSPQVVAVEEDAAAPRSDGVDKGGN